MKNIILAWLNANATNEAKANEIEYHCDKFASEFACWCFDRDLFRFQELLKQFKEERNEQER
jgi:hypothetical protein